MVTRTLASWDAFRTVLDGYLRQPRDRRDQIWFRGQPNAKDRLQATLDRVRAFSTDAERDATVARLLDEFKCEAIRVGLAFSHLPSGDALELLARHHGLPSPLIDWTESPFIASYFAYQGAHFSHSGPTHVAVWVLDRAKWPANNVPVQILDDVELVRFNKRALQQRGGFIRVATITQTVEQLLGAALTKFEITISDRDQALGDLDEMTVDATHLFGDLDGAAKTAALRVLG